jgi:hypothetical protein
MIMVTAALLLTTVVMLLPRIIEAKRLEASSADKNLSLTSALTSTPNLVPQDQKGDVQVVESYHNDTSKPLRDIKPQPLFSAGEHEANPNPKLPNRHIDSADPVVQGQFNDLKAMIAITMPATVLNFDGIGFPGVACNCAPPDTNGEVGATQYVQSVNIGFQVFNKTTGASVLGPLGIGTLWAGFGGPCETAGNGDPVVIYDQIANRWVISQFAGATVPTDECVAVSTTSDATGSFFRYGFHLGTNFFDYPHLSVWPDAYYMSMNVFNSAGTAFLGPQPFAFDRAKMLTGAPATFITTGITGGPTEETYLPADLDGSTLPPAGAPVSFVEFPGANTYKLWHFHVDFTTPANSTFTLFSSPAAAGFSVLCGATRDCVPQGGTTQRLDGIGDRLMFRLAYRNFGTHESVVGNYTVSSGGVAGIRWFELRNVTSGPVTKFQESTYQPDATWRWMGSAAMDQQGNIALGYSASSASINPQIRYAGRLATDPVSTLPQPESTLFAGTGSQTGGLNRWGDYSAMSVDPVDDCTFWYTTEYLAASGSFNWKTRIGSFKYPGCGGTPTPDFSMSTTPSSVTVTAGSTANYTQNVTRTGGFTGSVSLSISGLPAGATGTFTPNPNTGATSALAITTTSGTTPAGSYVFTVTGTSTTPALTRTSTATLVVQPPATPDFSLSTTPSSVTVTAGSTANYTQNVTRTGGFTGSVSLAISGLPAGAAGTFNPNPNTGATSALAITTTASTPAGSYVFTVTGTSTTPALTRTSTATLVVQAPGAGDFTLAITPASRSINPGQSTTYTITITRTGGFTGAVALSVSGLGTGATGTFSPNPATGTSSTLTVTTTTSATPGTRTFTVTGTSGGLTRTVTGTLVIKNCVNGNGDC